MRAFSLITLGGALFGSFYAYLTYAMLCFGESGGSTMCRNGHPSTTMTAQLVVALAGLVAAAYFAFCAFGGKKRRGTAVLVGGLLIWGAWALLNDAAVHGW